MGAVRIELQFQQFAFSTAALLADQRPLLRGSQRKEFVTGTLMEFIGSARMA